MVYPANYGFIPNTLSNDGDPADVLVLTHLPIVAGSVIRCRPIGALIMEDEAGMDEKILAVPVDKLNSIYNNVKSYKDLPEMICAQIGHFFEHYKDLEKGKWVKVSDWVDAEGAAKLIVDSIELAKK